ncbi:DNA-binding protein [Streptomyces sp. 3MP-14]|uniref:DNA-binding protein n=1 Tax=Streptomyces mimosae TaxID=2586635 RepID=A0A5N6AA29_9ACTN|nr:MULTISPECIES: DNA-binding protein [Streptomyces]KAB8164689.1 DNA-binding protein [Streptomyces mimosae]KAB8175605.1 DNA-binding protein [Streptomyces sp. 3MP-14]
MSASRGERTDLGAEIERRLRLLLADPGSAATSADWALAEMAGNAPELADDAVWTALDRLAGADLPAAPATPLHGSADYEAWLAEFLDRSRP